MIPPEITSTLDLTEIESLAFNDGTLLIVCESRAAAEKVLRMFDTLLLSDRITIDIRLRNGEKYCDFQTTYVRRTYRGFDITTHLTCEGYQTRVRHQELGIDVDTGCLQIDFDLAFSTAEHFIDVAFAEQLKAIEQHQTFSD